MLDKDTTNYGPLSGLIGTWQGNQGIDIAPAKTGSSNTAYFESLVFTGKGLVTNAGTQQLAVVHYHQSVQKQADGKTFHDQNGYWMWDEASDIIMHSFIIPRGVCVLAGGFYKVIHQRFCFEVNAANDDPKWPITQSEFMSDKAKTTQFQQHMELEADRLYYKQITQLEIYGQSFEHSDENYLQRSEC